MTTTATITPCPVAWCDQAGHHLYSDAEHPGDDFYALTHSRTCRHETGEGTGLEIGAEVFETDEGELMPPVVEIGGQDAGSFELTSPAEVNAFVTAVLAAAAVAFPESGDLPSVTPNRLRATEGAVRSSRSTGLNA
jgi:hypothetical protein